MIKVCLQQLQNWVFPFGAGLLVMGGLMLGAKLFGGNEADKTAA